MKIEQTTPPAAWRTVHVSVLYLASSAAVAVTLQLAAFHC